MGENEESFAVVPAVPSAVVSGEVASTNEDVFVRLLVRKLENKFDAANKVVDASKLQSMLVALLDMDLHLPENAEARESISNTNIIECLVKVLNATKTQGLHNSFPQLPSLVAELMQALVSGGHTKNIETVYHCGAVPILVAGMLGQIVSQYDQYDLRNKCSNVLKLLRTEDNPTEGGEFLLDFSSIVTVVSAMRTRPDMRDWGCSRLKYILQRWEKLSPSKVSKPLNPVDKAVPDDIGQAFLQTGAIDAILVALGAPDPSASIGFGASRPASTPGLADIREASACLKILAQKSPDVRSTLIKKGALAYLGTAMQKTPQDNTDVHGIAQQAILAILGTPA